MARRSRGSDTALALAHRALVLAGLIAEAALLYARHALSRRLGWRAGEVGTERFTRFAQRFVRVATRFRGGLIKLGQVASLRFEVLPEGITDELAKLRDRVEPHAYASIARQVEAELGARPRTCSATSSPSRSPPRALDRCIARPRWTAATWR